MAALTPWPGGDFRAHLLRQEHAEDPLRFWAGGAFKEPRDVPPPVTGKPGSMSLNLLVGGEGALEMPDQANV